MCFQDDVAAGADRVRECLCVFGMTGAGAFVCFQDDGEGVFVCFQDDV